MEAQPPKVLIHGMGYIDSNSHTLKVGYCMSGVTTYNTMMIDGLAKSGFQASLCCGRLGNGDDPPVFMDSSSIGIPTVEFDVSFRSELEPKGFFDSSLAQQYYQHPTAFNNRIYEKLANWCRESFDYFKPKIVNPHNLNALIAWIKAKQRFAIDSFVLVGTVHDLVDSQVQYLVLHQNQVNRIVAASHNVARRLFIAGVQQSKLSVISGGVNSNLFYQDKQTQTEILSAQWKTIAQRENIPNEPKFQAIVSARRIPEKGIQNAIEMFNAYCAHQKIEGTLLITGANMGIPAFQEKLKEIAERTSKKAALIHLLGPTTYGEMPALYHASQASLLLSQYPEGLGLANIEAMNIGCPIVITTGLGGISDYMLNNKNGFIVKRGDDAAVRNALGHVVTGGPAIEQMRKNAMVTGKI